MKYIIFPIVRFSFAICISIFMIACFCVIQIVYTIWTLKLKPFNKEWFTDENFWEYDANSSFENDPKKIFPTIFHWAADSLPKKEIKPEIEITKEPFLK